MIAQVLLTILLLLVICYAWIGAARAPAVSLMFVFVCLLGAYFVWVPDHATHIAQLVGIGRGVDLVLYVWVIVSLLTMLNLHLHIRAQMEIITSLARHIALTEALTKSAGAQAASQSPAKDDHGRIDG